MRVFLTGGSGWISSAVIPELTGAGHEVRALARSQASAAAVAAAGATAVPGDLDDLDGLRAAAKDSDGVVHLGFHHDFSDFDGALRTDARAIDAFADALEGTGKPLLVTGGDTGAARPGRDRAGRDGRPGARRGSGPQRPGGPGGRRAWRCAPLWS